jgi:hypothetical protein
MTKSPISFEVVEHRQKYWSALGEFMDTFAAVEAAMQIVLWHYARTSIPIARAIFSGVRIKEAIGFVNRICEIGGPTADLRDDLKYVFTQLNR